MLKEMEEEGDGAVICRECKRKLGSEGEPGGQSPKGKQEMKWVPKKKEGGGRKKPMSVEDMASRRARQRSCANRWRLRSFE